MSKNLNVALNFTANTSQAKTQIQELSNLLTKVAYNNNINVNSDSIKAASQAAKDLAFHLGQAYNKNTGNYDLSKLNASLQKSNQNIQTLSAELVKAGTTGQQAFIKLAQAISTADQPVLKVNKHLSEMWNTLKNTARWQVSSSFLHGLQGSIQTAYYYAQDLNESLNDIRIVTGASTDKMAKFAENANKAAKALGTTTTKYTDAALIYYQQGLSDQQVLERTNVTTKMANVTGENAEDVSSYMTAIWNNFDDGSKSIEYYADVITKLGAETAASSEEIANGLEKFAAVGETIGLSYEYATAALTTIIDKTRQSEDVVGTALKTIFARIQGLKEGEETEEGYDLNKYSAALQQYGISIFDANKELKDMDTILDEMGAKWQTLAKADQVYLAQTVAGVRQYNQLVSLMDNWADVQKNIASAANSDGSLQKQAEIYQESWEAASNRVRASLEAIYSDMIDDEFFIDVYNQLADLIDGVDNFIDSIGGMKTVLLGLGTVVLSMAKTKIGPALQDLALNVKIITGGAQVAYGKINKDTNKAINKIQDEENLDNIQKRELINAQQLIQVKNKLNIVNKNLTNSERAQAEMAIEGLQLQQQEVLELIKKEEELRQQIQENAEQGFKFSDKRINQTANSIRENFNNLGRPVSQQAYEATFDAQIVAADALEINLKSLTEQWYLYQAAQESIKLKGSDLFAGTINSLNTLSTDLQNQKMNMREVISSIEIYTASLPETITNTQEFQRALTAVYSSRNKKTLFSNIQDLIKIIKNAKVATEDLDATLISVGVKPETLREAKKKLKELEKQGLTTEKAIEEVKKTMDGFNPQHVVKTSEALVAFTSGLGSVAMLASSIKSAYETITNPDVSGLEKAISLMMTLSMMSTSIVGLASSMRTVASSQLALNAAIGLGIPIISKNTFASIENALSRKYLAKKGKEEAVVRRLVNAGIDQETANKLADTIVTEGLTEATKKQIAANSGLQLSMWQLTLVFAAVAAAIAAIVAVYKIIYNETHKARIEFENSKKTLEEVSENYENLSSAIDDVNTSLDDLDSRKETLDSLKYGSAEWREELYGINEEFDKILSQYDNLEKGKDWYIDSSGMKQFTDKGKKKIADENENRLNDARVAVDTATYINDSNEVAAKREEIARTLKYSGQIAVEKTKRKGKQEYTETEFENHKLTENALNTILSKMYENPDLDLSNSEALSVIQGLSEKDVQLITSNEKLQEALKDLTISTDSVREAYQSTLETNLLSDETIHNQVFGDESQIDEAYRSDLINQMAQDIEKNVSRAKETGILSTGEKAEDYIEEYKEAAQLIEENGKYYASKEDGSKGEEIKDIKKQTAAWKEQKIQIEKTKNSFDKYKEAVKKSKETWKAAKQLRDIEGQAGAWSKVKKALDDAGDSAENFEKDANFEQVQKGLQDMMGINDELAKELLKPEWIKANAEQIEAAINGDAEALDGLKLKAKEDLLIKAKVITTPEELTTELNDSISIVDSLIKDIEVGAIVDDTKAIETLDNLLEQGKISKEQLQSYLSFEGWNTSNLKFEPIPGKKKLGFIDKILFWKNEGHWPTGDEAYETVGYRIIEGSSMSKENDGGGSSSLTTSGGSYIPTIEENTINTGDKGSGLTDKKGDLKDKKSIKDEQERYHVIREQIEGLQKEYDKLSKAKERAWGKDKLALLDQEQEKLQKLIAKQDRYIEKINNYLPKDREAIAAYGAKFDKDGNITNYNTLIREQVEKFNASRTEAAEAEYEKFKQALEQYEETLDLKADAEQERLDLLYQWQDSNYEELTHEVELKVQINENDKKALDFAFSSISEDVYKASEALALIWSDTDFDLIDQATQALDNNSFAITRLKEDYEAGKISKTDYLEKMQEEYDSIFDNVEALQELDEQMKEYYGNTLDMAIEEISKYTNHMDSLTSVLDHYKSILELTGRGQNYDAMDKILQGQAKTLKNNYDVAKKNYEMLLKEKETVEARIKAMDVTSAGYEMEKEKLDKLIAETDAAYDEMLSDAESYLSVLQEIWTAALENIKEETEKALTGNMGFDSLMDSLNNLKDYQDEYLTKVNQEFEMQKLMSNVQRDIDKTNNVAAKQRLNNFAKEIEQLEEKDKLSNLELEIAQAKYKQLQAQIALEEAQNAKSVVRLSRDNEGNYGYVYTADQDAISEAEDELAQAENDLYNIRLNATNEYGEKMLQAEQEYLDKVAEIWEKYGDDDETRNKELARVKEEFYQLIDTYSELYTIAQQEDTNVVRDAWINQYDDILGASLDWKTKLEEYVQAIEDKHEEWQAVAGPILDDLNLKTNNLATAVNSVTTKSNEMKDALIKEGGVIDTLGTELSAVNDVTAAYEAQRDMIQEVIDKMLEKAKLIQAELKEESGVTGWNTHIGDRITSLKEEGKTIAQWENDQTGQIHYMSYDPNKMTEKEAEDALKKKYGTEKFNDAAEWNEKIATKLNGLEEPRYHGYDINGKYHYHKTREGLEKILKKYGGKMPGSKITYYDTGGYTGEWGPEGKLAMLHEKEIVLNKEDSANILKVVEIVRTMIDNNAANAGIGILHSPGINTQNQNLEQTVTITAEFPNATDHNEIEMAFNSLINKATQFANRK